MTVHKILDYYLEEGMIAHAGKGFSTEEGGKKPNLFSFNASCRYLYAIRLGADSFVASVVNLKGESVVPKRKISLVGATFEDAITLMGNCFREQMEEGRLPAEDCLAVVVGCNGIVDPESGICLAAYHYPQWDKNLPLRGMLRQVMPESVPIHIDSWWRYLAYGEMHFAEGESRNRFFLIGNSGDYISGGMITDGVVHSGAGAFAGEIGHLVVAPAESSSCVCGGGGCFESLVAPGRVRERIFASRDSHPDSVLFKELREDGPMDFAVLSAAAEKGDPLAVLLLDEVAAHFAVAINNIVQICDPGTVVLFGDFALAGEFFFRRLRETFDALNLHGVDKRTVIVPSVLGDEHGVVGAANHMTDSLFSNGR